MLINFTHPNKTVTESYPNTSARQHLSNFVTLHQELKVVNWKEAECVSFTHDNFPIDTLHYERRYVYVVQEGIPIYLFNPDTWYVVFGVGGKTGQPE